MSSLLFYSFAIAIVLSALAVVFNNNPVKAVLSLIFCFVNTAGLYILLGAEYIAMTLVIVYVGAVAVLFLFVVMMLNLTSEKNWRIGFKEVLGYSFVVAILTVQIALALNYAKTLPQGFEKGDPEYNQDLIVTHLEKKEKNISIGTSNTKQIGIALYNQYILQLQIMGLVLLVAMVGAVMLIMAEKNEARIKTEDLAKTRQKLPARLFKVQSRTGVNID